MTQVTHGMDIEEIEALGHRLRTRYAAAIRDVAAQVDSMVRGSYAYWNGSDAERFRSWWPAKRQRLLAMAADLDEFGRTALTNAGEQRAASRAGGAAGQAGAWASHGGATISAPGWLPSFADIVDVADLAHSGVNTVLHGGARLFNIRDPVALSEDVLGSSELLGRYSGAFDAFGQVVRVADGAVDAVRFFEAIDQHGWSEETLRAGIDVAWDLASVKVRVLKGGFDVGYAFGNLLGDGLYELFGPETFAPIEEALVPVVDVASDLVDSVKGFFRLR